MLSLASAILLAATLPNFTIIDCPTLIIPASASAPGLSGTFFRTDVWITNLVSLPTEINVSYLCASGCKDGAIPRSVVLPFAPNETRLLPDIAVSIFGLPGSSGAIRVWRCFQAPITPTPPDYLFATSRTYTGSGVGTFGTEVPPVPSTKRALFIGLAHARDLDSGFRTNIGLVNPTYGLGLLDPPPPATATLTLRDSSGESLGTRTVSVWEPIQINDVFAYVGASEVFTDNAMLRVESDKPLVPYVIVIDNQSGDSRFLQYLPLVPATP